MRDNFRQFAFAFALLVLGAGLEESFPKVFGVGFPFLLSAVHFSARRQVGLPIVMAIALAAGAFEDAVSGLPAMTSASYFLVVAMFVRWLEWPALAAALTYPCHHMWLSVWTAGLSGGIFGRVLLAAPIGLLTATVTGAAISFLVGKAALDEQG